MTMLESQASLAELLEEDKIRPLRTFGGWGKLCTVGCCVW